MVVGGGEVLVVGAVRGLVSESEAVRQSSKSFQPDAVAISISKEQLQAMLEHIGSGADMAELDNIEEEFYVEGLKRFGEVKKPPPCFVEAWRLCDKEKIPLYPVDFDDVEFTDLYCHYVSGLEWLRQPSKQRTLAKKKFYSKTAQEFTVEWDKIVNRSKGLRSMEQAREDKIARETGRLAAEHSRVMLVVDYERAGAVAGMLSSAGVRLRAPQAE